MCVLGLNLIFICVFISLVLINFIFEGKFVISSIPAN